jgi:hypothetical protein
MKTVRGSLACLGLWVLVLALAPACDGGGSSSPELVSITIEAATGRIAVDETLQLTARGQYSDGASSDLTGRVGWTSSDPTVAGVDAGGLVTGLSAGTAQISAQAEGVTSQAYPLEVVAAAERLVSIQLDPGQLNLQIGAAGQLSATGTYLDGQSRDITTEVVWTSSDDAVAGVSNTPGSEGQVVGLAGGSAEVSAALDDVISDPAAVEVSAVSLVSLEVTPIEPSVPVGQHIQFTATGRFSDDSTANMTTLVRWTSSNPLVADFSDAAGEQGRCSGLIEGSVRISASFGGVTSAERTLNVVGSSLVELQIEPMTAELAVGATQQFSASGVFSDGQVLDLTDSVSWLSDDPAVVDFDAASAGQARAVAEGQAVVWAETGEVTSAQASVTVSSATLEAIEVAPILPSLPVGQQLQFSATGHYSDQTSLDLTEAVSWSSSDPAVASVSNAAGSQGLATGLSEGSTAVRAALGEVVGEQELQVEDLQIVSLSLSPDSASLPLGESLAFAATALYNNGSQAEVTQTVSWHVANALVAEVSNADGERGLVTAIGQGSTTLWATAPNGVAASPVEVSVTSASLDSISISPQNPSAVLGAQVVFSATGHYSDGSQLDLTAEVTWSSSDPAVATISNAGGSRGVATTLSLGETLIGAERDGVSASQVRLEVVAASLESISLAPAAASIAVGEAVQFSATGHYSDGQQRDVTAQAYWTASDPDVAHLSNAVDSKGLATGLAEGAAQVGASLQGIASAPADLTVSAPLNQQPVAVISGDSNGTVGAAASFSGAGSSDADGSITNYIFDFGDGSPAVDNGAEPEIEHVFDAANTYTVTLTVRDDLGATGSAAHQIAVVEEPNEAPQAVLICPGSGQVGQLLDFDGASSYDPDGSIVNYTFNFGDGSGDHDNGGVPTMQHAFATENVYTVYLTVTDDDGAQHQASCPVSIGAATVPEVNIIRPQGNIEVTQGDALLVLVDATGQGGHDVTHVELLADGAVAGSDDTAPYEFDYTVPADAATDSTIVLQARAYDDADPAGMGQSDPVMLEVRNYPPLADFTASVSDVLQVTVDASASSDVETDAADLEVRFDWEADGAYDTAWSTQKIQNHTYAAEGDYTIRMQVRDAVDQTDASERSVSLASQQTVGGTISTTTWYGTIIMTGSVTVPAGEVLTINPGTQVLVMYLDQDGDGEGDFGLDIQGQLLAEGTAAEPVLFSMYGADHKEPGAWQGIAIDGDAPSSLISCVVEYAVVGVTLGDDSGLSDCTLRFNRDAGLLLDTAHSATLDGILAHDNTGAGLVWLDSADVTALDVTSQDNGTHGLRLDNSDGGSLDGCDLSRNGGHGLAQIDSSLAVDGCTVSENSGMGVLYRGDADGSLGHSQVTYNGDVGIRAESAGGGDPQPVIRYNNVYGNSVAGGTVDLVADPSGTLDLSGPYSAGSYDSSLWTAPQNGLLRRAYVDYDDYYYATGYLLTELGVVQTMGSSWTGWVWLSDEQVSSLQVRLSQSYNSNSNSNNRIRVTQVEYTLPDGVGVELSVANTAGVVDARYNYWGIFPNVLDHISYTRAAGLDIQGFVGQAFDASWDTGPYFAGELASQTWSGTVYVTGDVSVPADQTLTVEAGTQVQFVPIDQDADGIGDYALDVAGSLLVQGAAGDPVVFTAHGATPQTADWDRVRIHGAGGSDLSWAELRYAQVGLELEDGSSLSEVLLANCNRYGLWLDGADGAVLDAVTVENNADIGVYALDTDGAELGALTVRSNAGVGLWAAGCSSTALHDAVVRENGSHGLVLVDSELDISYSNLLYNGGEGLRYMGPSAGSLSNCNVKYNDLPGVVALMGDGTNPSPVLSWSNIYGNAVVQAEAPGSADPSATLDLSGPYSAGSYDSGVWTLPVTGQLVRAYLDYDDYYYATGYLRTAAGSTIATFGSSWTGWIYLGDLDSDGLQVRLSQSYNSNSNSNNRIRVTEVEYLEQLAPATTEMVTLTASGQISASHNYWGQQTNIHQRLEMSRPDAVDFTSWELAEVPDCGPR